MPVSLIGKPKRYRKKPVVIEAVKVAPESQMTLNDIAEWCGGTAEKTEKRTGVNIRTLEGYMFANMGDYIIKGVKGEFYPCKADIFEATYEPA